MPFNLSDNWDVDDASGLPLHSPKRTLSDCEDNGRPKFFPKTNRFGISNYQSVVTAMDWNSGGSPLESWLKQSAMPSVVPSVVEEVECPSYDALTKHVEEEIKAFPLAGHLIF